MRAAKGIFRTVNKPFGKETHVLQRVIEYHGLECAPLGRPQNDNSFPRPFHIGQFLS